MSVIGYIFVFALLGALASCSNYKGVTSSHPQTVEVSSGLPASATNAVLFLRAYEFSDISSTNLYSSWGGSRSMQYQGGGGSFVNGTNETWHHEQLIAINAEGFEMLFTKKWRFTGPGQKINQETNVTLFRFGQITETNTLGWSIIGKFK